MSWLVITFILLSSIGTGACMDTDSDSSNASFDTVPGSPAHPGVLAILHPAIADMNDLVSDVSNSDEEILSEISSDHDSLSPISSDIDQLSSISSASDYEAMQHSETSGDSLYSSPNLDISMVTIDEASSSSHSELESPYDDSGNMNEAMDAQAESIREFDGMGPFRQVQERQEPSFVHEFQGVYRFLGNPHNPF